MQVSRQQHRRSEASGAAASGLLCALVLPRSSGWGLMRQPTIAATDNRCSTASRGEGPCCASAAWTGGAADGQATFALLAAARSLAPPTARAACLRKHTLPACRTELREAATRSGQRLALAPTGLAPEHLLLPQPRHGPQNMPSAARGP